VVAGVVALMLGAQPGLTPADVESILEGAARDLGPPGWDPAFGHGRIDAAAAGALAQIVVREAPPACDDGLDNDGDGWVDHPADVGCGDAADPSERSTTACGLGFELAAALPALAARLRRAGRHGAARRG
jgi:hypothetical protein